MELKVYKVSVTVEIESTSFEAGAEMGAEAIMELPLINVVTVQDMAGKTKVMHINTPITTN